MYCIIQYSNMYRQMEFIRGSDKSVMFFKSRFEAETFAKDYAVGNWKVILF
jgi:hypothetical protein